MANLPTLRRNELMSTWFDDFDHSFGQHWRKLIDQFFHPQKLNELQTKLLSSGYPKLDVLTNEGTFSIQAAVPGVEPKDLTVEVVQEGDQKFVKISGQMSKRYDDLRSENSVSWRVKELRRSKFTRIVPIPDTLEGDPTAVVRNGILDLTWKVPKEPTPETRLIPVKVEE